MTRNWLESKTVFLTGASSGIGRELTKLLIRVYGCKVIGVGLNEEKMQSLCVELGERSAFFEYRLFDVSRRENWQACVLDLENSGTGIDILINNAGIMPRFASVETELPAIHLIVRRVIATNFIASVDSVSLMLPILMRSPTPAIINMASAAAFAAMPGTAAYSAAKAAQKAFTECLMMELKGRAYVAGIYPGFVRTDLFRDQKKGLADRRLARFYLSSQETARSIMNGMARHRRMIIPGQEARMMRLLERLLGLRALDLFTCILKKARAELFADVFKWPGRIK